LLVASKSIEDTVERMRAGKEVTFADLENVCRRYFGAPRVKGSHHIFKTPWPGDPRINIQNDKGKAKAYQVRQVVQALDKLAEQVLAAKRAAEKDKEKADKPKKK
jgi:hypothetical protein